MVLRQFRDLRREREKHRGVTAVDVSDRVHDHARRDVELRQVRQQCGLLGGGLCDLDGRGDRASLASQPRLPLLRLERHPVAGGGPSHGATAFADTGLPGRLLLVVLERREVEAVPPAHEAGRGRRSREDERALLRPPSDVPGRPIHRARRGADLGKGDRLGDHSPLDSNRVRA